MFLRTVGNQTSFLSIIFQQLNWLTPLTCKQWLSWPTNPPCRVQPVPWSQHRPGPPWCPVMTPVRDPSNLPGTKWPHFGFFFLFFFLNQKTTVNFLLTSLYLTPCSAQIWGCGLGGARSARELSCSESRTPLWSPGRSPSPSTTPSPTTTSLTFPHLMH